MASTVYGGGADLKDFAANFLKTYQVGEESEARRRDNNAQTSRDTMNAMIARQQIQAQSEANRNANLTALLNATSQRKLEQDRMAELARQFDEGLKVKSKLAGDEIEASKEIAKLQRIDPRIEQARNQAETDKALLKLETDRDERAQHEKNLAEIRQQHQLLKSKRDEGGKPVDLQNYQNALKPLLAKAQRYSLDYDPDADDFFVPAKGGSQNMPIPIPFIIAPTGAGGVQSGPSTPIPVIPSGGGAAANGGDGLFSGLRGIMQTPGFIPNTGTVPYMPPAPIPVRSAPGGAGQIDPEIKRRLAARMRELIALGVPDTVAADMALKDILP